jgi:hypothetical protein
MNIVKETTNNYAENSYLKFDMLNENKMSHLNPKGLFSDMTFSSIDNSPLCSLYNSLEQEKYMIRELTKKGLSTINTLSNSENDSTLPLLSKNQNERCAALKLKVQNLKNYTDNLIRSEYVDLSEVYSYFITKQKLIEQNIKEGELTTIISNKGQDNAEIPNLATISSNDEIPVKKEENVKLPPFIYFYPNISVNENQTISQSEDIAAGMGEGILNKSIINYNKYLKNLNFFNPEIAANKTIDFKFVEKIRIPIKNLYNLLVASLNPTKALISQPCIYESTNEIKINLFFFLFGSDNKNNLNLKNTSQSYIQKNAKRFKLLCENLSQIFKKEISLDLTRLHSPKFEGQILATSLGSLTKKNRFNKFINKFFRSLKTFNPSRIIDNTLFDYNSLYGNKNINPAYLSGVSVKVAGRLITEKVVPRKTVRSFQIGSLARSKADMVLTDRYTNKNKRGCFSVTIKTGHYIN